MHFLPDVYVTCEVCKGKRYNRETLEVKYKGRAIADVLAMTGRRGARVLQHIPPIRRHLQTFDDVGLGYMELGQPARRCRAARPSGSSSPPNSQRPTRARRSTSSTNRPPACTSTTSASCSTCSTAWSTGNTVIVVEHNLDVIKTADWIIDLGPEGGDEGGTVVVAGRPKTWRRTPSRTPAGSSKRVLTESRTRPPSPGGPGGLASISADMHRRALLILATVGLIATGCSSITTPAVNFTERAHFPLRRRFAGRHGPGQRGRVDRRGVAVRLVLRVRGEGAGGRDLDPHGRSGRRTCRA